MGQANLKLEMFMTFEHFKDADYIDEYLFDIMKYVMANADVVGGVRRTGGMRLSTDWIWASIVTGKLAHHYRILQPCLQVGRKVSIKVGVEYVADYDKVFEAIVNAVELKHNSSKARVTVALEETQEAYPKKMHNRSFGAPVIDFNLCTLELIRQHGTAFGRGARESG